MPERMTDARLEQLRNSGGGYGAGVECVREIDRLRSELMSQPSPTWYVTLGKVYRKGRPVAAIYPNANGTFAWEGMGMRRDNLKSEAALLDDVKYFYRYPSKRGVTFTFQSGRKVHIA